MLVRKPELDVPSLQSMEGHIQTSMDGHLQTSMEGHLQTSMEVWVDNNNRTNLKQNTFTLRVVNAWNLLPNHVVTAPLMNYFKNRLDSIWHDHPWRFDFESKLGTYYTSRLYTPHRDPRYDETTISEEGYGHRGQQACFQYIIR